MAGNYVLLETIALTQSAASVTFDNLPTSGYTDLKIVLSARVDAGSGGYQTYVRFNGDTAANYNWRNLLGTGSSAISQNTSGDTGMRVTMSNSSGDTASTFGNSEVYIPNYRGSTAKSVSADGVSENNATAATADLAAGLWTGTAAITSITIFGSGANFVANSTFSLYGVAAYGTTPVLAPKATGGNSIENNGTYWIHTFTSSGTFTPQVGLTCDYLVVAGGGGGAFTGGGGAGGLRSTVTATGGGGSLETPLSLSATGYTVTVGAGGAGGGGTNGVDSVFSTITSTGGGRANINAAGTTGGSGGGGALSGNAGGSGTTNQGFAGGAGNTNSGIYTVGGGGGGAGVAGTAATTTTAGNGGNGVATSITGSSVTYGGGGGGSLDTRISGFARGTAGSGGGGLGSITAANGSDGSANTGGGGGGGTFSGGTVYNGGAGGSGIVIIRYPIA